MTYGNVKIYWWKFKKDMENIDKVLYVEPFEVGNKTALFAVVNEKPGIYRKIQITKE